MLRRWLLMSHMFLMLTRKLLLVLGRAWSTVVFDLLHFLNMSLPLLLGDRTVGDTLLSKTLLTGLLQVLMLKFWWCFSLLLLLSVRR